MLKRFIGRFLCLIFGHSPQPVTFNFQDGRQEVGDLQVMTLGGGPSVQALAFNICTRCDELARHRAREALITEKIRGMIAGEAKAKADAEAAEQSKRKPGESLKAYRARVPQAPALAAVPNPKPTAPEPGNA
jgi:hypothetical protein